VSNQNYSEFKSRNANKNSAGPGVKARKGEYGAEHDAAHKDTKTSWPKAPGQRSPSLNRSAKFSIVKTVVNSDGVDV
jgi:hypothetical protein